MRQAARDAFVPFTARFEGFTDFLYQDVKGYVTIGLGLLVDPVGMLAGVDFVRPDGTPADRQEVEAAWWTVRRAMDRRFLGGMAFQSLTTIRATQESLARLADAKLSQMEEQVRRFFPGWDDFPAAGQLLILSMAWAMGPLAFRHWPHFVDAVNAGDWAATAVEHGHISGASCQMDEVGQNASFRARNAANMALAKQAAEAVESGELDALV